MKTTLIYLSVRRSVVLLCFKESFEKICLSKNKTISVEGRHFHGTLYAREACVLTNESARKISAFKRKCYRKIMRVGWSQKVTNGQQYSLLQEVI